MYYNRPIHVTHVYYKHYTYVCVMLVKIVKYEPLNFYENILIDSILTSQNTQIYITLFFRNKECQKTHKKY